MTIRIVRLGSPRVRGEGSRLGTVRRPPRGVPKTRYRDENWYDVWLPNLAPSEELRTSYLESTSPNRRATFERQYRNEMKRPEARHILDALAELSHSANFSVGCYCEEETECHRSILRELFRERGARIE